MEHHTLQVIKDIDTKVRKVQEDFGNTVLSVFKPIGLFEATAVTSINPPFAEAAQHQSKSVLVSAFYRTSDGYGNQGKVTH